MKNNNNFKVNYVLEDPPTEWNGELGYVSKEIIQNFLPKPDEQVLIYVCGPRAMLQSICGLKSSGHQKGDLDGILKDVGFKIEQVYKF